MKPAEQKISDASFTGHYFKLLVIRLKQFKTAKHVVLIGVVLICLLTRYLVLLYDNGLNKLQTVTEKYQKNRSRVYKPNAIRNGFKIQIINPQNFRKLQFNSSQRDFHYFIVNDVQ